VLAAGVPPFAQVRIEGGEDRPARRARTACGERARAQEGADRVAAHAQGPRDCALAKALSVQHHNLLIPCLPPYAADALLLLWACAAGRARWWSPLAGRRAGEFAHLVPRRRAGTLYLARRAKHRGGRPDAGLLAREHALDHLAHIGEEMPAVGDLGRLRSPLARAVGIGPGAVATNDRDAGMRAQPGGEGLRRAVGQQINRAVALEIFLGLLSFHAQSRPLRRLP